MNDNQDNKDQDCDGYHRPFIRTHSKQLQLVVVTTVCILLITAVVDVLLDRAGVGTWVAVLSLAVLLGMIIRRLLRDGPNGDDDF